MAMNITIDQSSIETAIETHVRELIPGLAEDTMISIILSATRGPSGFTASIDLLPARAVETPAATPASAPVETKPVKASKALNIPKANEKTETVAQTSNTADLSAETVKETPVDNVVDAADASDEPQAKLPPASSASSEETTEDAPRASLFSGLNKPKN